MKRTLLQDFKQIYKKNGEEHIYNYQVTIVLDTQDYKYRIINVTSGSVWKNNSFETYDEAKNFLCKHPHFTGSGKEVELNKLY